MNALLEFSVANNRSINDLCTLSMVGTGISDEPVDNIVKLGNNKVLKSAVIYGANSSGKSNIVKSINKMKGLVLTSVRLNDGDELDYEPFLLSHEPNKPTQFEIVFIDNKQHKFRYGFQLNSKEIVSEWLCRSTLASKDEKDEKELFYREFNSIDYDKKLFAEGEGKDKIINSNRLLISLCAQLGGKESKRVVSWFQHKIKVISGIKTEMYATYSKLMLNDQLGGCDKAKRFFTQLRLGFNDIECIETEFDTSQLPEDLSQEIKDRLSKSLAGKKQIDLYSLHNVYDEDGRVVKQATLNVESAESEGTKKLIELSGPIFDTLEAGNTLIIDELDVKLHPHITHHIIGLFNNPRTNPNGAQLIFTTHDTHLLSSKLFRRDQIWFTEKDSKEQTDLYNMMDIVLPDGSKPRNDANYEKNYIAGRYGAVPFISKIE